MPKDFEQCVDQGGKVRTKVPKPGRYQKICIPPGGGKGSSVGGEVHKTKAAKARSKGGKAKGTRRR